MLSNSSAHKVKLYVTRWFSDTFGRLEHWLEANWELVHHTVSFWRNILQVGKLAELGLEEESENQQLSVKTPSRLLTWYNEAVEVLSSDGLTSSRSTSGVLTAHTSASAGRVRRIFVKMQAFRLNSRSQFWSGSLITHQATRISWHLVIHGDKLAGQYFFCSASREECFSFLQSILMEGGRAHVHSMNYLSSTYFSYLQNCCRHLQTAKSG